MKNLLTTATRALAAFSLICAMAPTVASARPEVTASPALRCGTITSLVGTVAILDSDRREFREVAVGGPVYCGDWVSTESGRIQLKLPRVGRVTIGAQTFLQLLDATSGENLEHDDFVLYRGDAYYEGATKGHAVHLVTPNARVTFSEGNHIVSYAEDAHSSQLIALQGASTIENRYLKHPPWKVTGGHFSVLADEMGKTPSRTLPGTPIVPDPKGLEAKLLALDVPTATRKSILDAVSTLVKHKEVVRLGSHPVKEPAATAPVANTVNAGRRPASIDEGAGTPDEEKHFFTSASDIAPDTASVKKDSTGNETYEATERNPSSVVVRHGGVAQSTETRGPGTAKPSKKRGKEARASAKAKAKITDEEDGGDPNERKRLLDRLAHVEEEDQG